MLKTRKFWSSKIKSYTVYSQSPLNQRLHALRTQRTSTFLLQTYVDIVSRFGDSNGVVLVYSIVSCGGFQHNTMDTAMLSTEIAAHQKYHYSIYHVILNSKISVKLLSFSETETSVLL